MWDWESTYSSLEADTDPILHSVTLGMPLPWPCAHLLVALGALWCPQGAHRACPKVGGEDQSGRALESAVIEPASSFPHSTA